MGEFSFEIKQEFGKISENGKYTKEFNLISYGGAEPKYDIRTWITEEDGTKKMSKGITLSKEELKTLKEMLANIEV